MVTHDEVHLAAQERYWREHPEERPKPQGYLHRVSEAARRIDCAVDEMKEQRLNGEHFSADFRGLVGNMEQRLWEITSTLRRAIEAEAQRESSR